MEKNDPLKRTEVLPEDVNQAKPPRMLYLIKQIQYKTYVRLEAALEPTGITAAQFRILASLERETKLSSAALARSYGVKPQTMFKQIIVMENLELIHRTTSKHNKRVLEAKLTEKGEAALAECEALALSLEDEIFSSMTPPEKAIFRQYMVKLIEDLRGREQHNMGASKV